MGKPKPYYIFNCISIENWESSNPTTYSIVEIENWESPTPTTYSIVEVLKIGKIRIQFLLPSQTSNMKI